MLLGAFPFDHARQHEGAVDDEALDLWCAPGLALEVHQVRLQCMHMLHQLEQPECVIGLQHLVPRCIHGCCMKTLLVAPGQRSAVHVIQEHAARAGALCSVKTMPGALSLFRGWAVRIG